MSWCRDDGVRCPSCINPKRARYNTSDPRVNMKRMQCLYNSRASFGLLDECLQRTSMPKKPARRPRAIPPRGRFWVPASGREDVVVSEVVCVPVLVVLVWMLGSGAGVLVGVLVGGGLLAEIPWKFGGSSASSGLVRAPTPHWTGSPLAAVSVPVGVTVSPSASAMVKRVVKSGSVEKGEVNL